MRGRQLLAKINRCYLLHHVNIYDIIMLVRGVKIGGKITNVRIVWQRPGTRVIRIIIFTYTQRKEGEISGHMCISVLFA